MPDTGPTDPADPLAPDVVELRVHGVSGTPPRDLLDRQLTAQVAGDRIAGFHRPALDDERRDDAPDRFAHRRANAPELVSYNWGGLTSGSPGRALWLVLLPFTLANVAPRARPAGLSARDGHVRALWWGARALAIALTALYTLTGVGVGMDLVAWQCSGGRSCTGASPDFVFHDLNYTHRFSIEHMLLLGLLVPVAQLLLLWLVSSRTANRYERTVAAGTPDDGDAVPEFGLDSPHMWRSAEPVRRLRALHMQVGFAVVLWCLLSATEAGWDHWWDPRGRWWSLVPLAVVVYALVALACPVLTRPSASRAWRRVSTAVWALLALAGLVQVLGLAVAHRWVEGEWLDDVRVTGAGRNPDAAAVAHRTPIGGLPHFDGTVLGISAAAVLALAVVAVATVWLRWVSAGVPGVGEQHGDHRPLPPPMAGLGTVVLAAFGLFLAAGLSSGAYMYAAAWLDTGSLKPSYRDVSWSYVHFAVPGTITTANIAYALALAGLAVTLLLVGGRAVVRAFRSPGADAELAADHPGHDTPGATDEEERDRRRRTGQVRRAVYVAGLVDTAPRLLGPITVVGVVLVGWLGVRLVSDSDHPPDHVVGSIDSGWLSAGALGAVGTYLAIFTLIGLVTLGSLAFRVPATRRSVGVLWDVASFWPRLAHPLAAPCYAERTVPDLVTWVTAHRQSSRDAGVVLAAHSQGTVISAAVVRQLAVHDEGCAPTDAVTPRVALLTFGCVLRRLYGRYFPAWFGPAELHGLQQVLTDDRGLRWINLWRYTDYLGGQVTAGPPQVVAPAVQAVGDPPDAPPTTGPVEWEWHAPDPSAFDRLPGDTTYTTPGRHSVFWSDRSGYFQLAVERLARRLGAGGTPPPATPGAPGGAPPDTPPGAPGSAAQDPALKLHKGMPADAVPTSVPGDAS